MQRNLIIRIRTIIFLALTVYQALFTCLRYFSILLSSFQVMASLEQLLKDRNQTQVLLFPMFLPPVTASPGLWCSMMNVPSYHSYKIHVGGGDGCPRTCNRKWAQGESKGSEPWTSRIFKTEIPPASIC